MADEIIDLRDRIEKMRIEIENEATEQISVDAPLEVHQKTSNSNISLSMENKNSFLEQIICNSIFIRWRGNWLPEGVNRRPSTAF